ncbi:MAG: heme-binding protein [Candidatus Thermoplasmatota archaeon]|nr:heme-binding protein [Candidatus Thermoplasmatota archaeon]
MTDTIPYIIERKLEAVEIRQYPDIVLAVVENNVDDTGFSLLFDYISGENTTRSRIPMTTPVISSEKIKMTAPVITGKTSMAFVLPSSYTMQTAPLPTNPSVHLVQQPKRRIAVLRFSGKTTQESVQKYTAELMAVLKTKGVAVTGESLLMRYNSPFTPGFLRRNEVAVEIIE